MNEVRKKRKRKEKRRDVVGMVVCILVCILFTTLIIKDIGTMRACGVSVEANILSIEEIHRSNRERRYATVNYVVEDQVYVRSVEIGYRHQCAEGDKLEIHYNPQKPEQCIFRKHFKFELIFYTVVYGIFLVLSVLAFRLEKKEKYNINKAGCRREK